jgi:glucose-1-phosphate adenylyltransferase
MRGDLLTFVLAGGVGERLFPLTLYRAKPAVPFAGMYRIIDFTLSNCINSEVWRIFLLSQYRSESLERHIRQGWNFFQGPLGEFLISLPPQMRLANEWYQGTADAIFQNTYVLEREKPDHVLILSGDHIYRMDYRKFMHFHLEQGAEATVSCVPVPKAEAERFGVVEVDERMRIRGFHEKKVDAPEIPGRPGWCLANMGVYLFSTRTLAEAVARDSRNTASSHDFGKDIFPALVGAGRGVYAFPFPEGCPDGSNFWRDIGTLDAYFQIHMDLLGDAPPFPLEIPDWIIHTYRPPQPPTRMNGAEVGHSLISHGCRVGKARISWSVLGPGVEVGDGCSLDQCIIFPGCRIESGAVLKKVIMDKHCRIPRDFRLEDEIGRDGLHQTVTGGGIVVFPRMLDLTALMEK